MLKVALITGITGQDGSYLARLLLEKGYEVHGIKRRSSSINTARIDDIYQDPFVESKNLYLHYGDMVDSTNLSRIVHEVMPDEIYNLAAQSHVAVSFETPEYTAEADAVGVLKILECIRYLSVKKPIKFYQASTSELYGMVQEKIQSEKTPFYPRSPYGVAKLYAYWIVKNYREAYNIFATNGILFNHESPLRGETFVTRKITMGLAKIINGQQDTLYLGNIYAKRDWGHAKEYVYAMWKMMQQKTPDDYVISTGEQHSVKDFIEICLKHLGVTVEWTGKGVGEKAIVVDSKNKKSLLGKKIIQVDERYFRPAEVETLIGDSTKAKKDLGWNPSIKINELAKEMIDYDLNLLQQ